MKEIRPIDGYKKRLFLICYIFLAILCLISPFFIFFYYIESSYFQNLSTAYGLFLYGGLIGIIVLSISIVYFYFLKIRKSIIAGGIGCFFILFNIIIIMLYFLSTLVYPYSAQVILGLGVYLYILSFLGISITLVRLYKYREPLKERRVIESRDLLIVTIISILYLIFAVIYFIMLFVLDYIFYLRANLFFVIGLVGLLFISLSLFFLIRTLHIQRSLGTAIIGYTFLLLIEISSLGLNPTMGLLRMIMVILMIITNGLLLRYRKLEPTPLSERKKMIREINLYDYIKRKDLPRDEEIKEGSVVTPVKKIKSKNIISAREVERRLTPEELEEKRKTESEVGVVRKEFICVVHKGEIDGPIYLCPYCHTLYCQKCATALKEKGEKCWSCEKEINL